MKAMTWTKFMDRVSEGRGQGHGANYRPWLWVHRKNSSPVSNQSVVRLPGEERAAHFYSRTEKVVAKICKYIAGDAIDIREQFPLWPMPHAHPLIDGVACWNDPSVRGLWEIAEEAKIPHGVEPGSLGVPYVATMDLMLTLSLARGTRLRGLSIKPHDKVTKAEPSDRLLERHELERRYMREVQGSHKIIDASLFNKALQNNIEILSRSANVCLPSTQQVEDYFRSLQRCRNSPMATSLTLSAACTGLTPEVALEWFRAGVWQRKIDVDLSDYLHPERPIPFGREVTDLLSIELFGEVI